jgi:hypothetical protein
MYDRPPRRPRWTPTDRTLAAIASVLLAAAALSYFGERILSLW